MTARQIVVMGVSGCGKSSVAAQLAQALAYEFMEGDAWHSAENVARMAAGVALTDADRRDWLEALSAQLGRAAHEGRGLVLACSALRRGYRDLLRRQAPGLCLVHLQGARELLASRLARRAGHYMPLSLLDSQLATLEPPDPDESAMMLDISVPVSELVAAVLAALASGPSPSASPSQEQTLIHFTRTVLFTDTDGRARFREELIPLNEGTPASRLSALFASGGYQLRESPVGFRSQFHCTGSPQWCFILAGQMEIGLQDGSSRVFGPGQHFYSADTLPEGAVFDPQVHGHWSRQVGDQPLRTLFVRG